MRHTAQELRQERVQRPRKGRGSVPDNGATEFSIRVEEKEFRITAPQVEAVVGECMQLKRRNAALQAEFDAAQAELTVAP